jgi:hypothetical protein
MNLAKSKVVLKKINTLYESLELGDEISKIEKDLLLDYVKELYEAVLELPSKKGKKYKKSLEHEMKKKARSEHEMEFIPIPESEKVKKKIEPAFEEVIDTVANTKSSNGIHSKISSVDNAPTNAVLTPVNNPVSPEIENLFDPAKLNQSDYRFSQTPITDITKAMGINEKLLMINLLFNKDQQDFNYVASKLHYFNTFEEASKYLKSEVAGKYDWSHVDKKEKAIEFIKLIKRKYVS